ncbi:PEPxxWA-CTERM sorting domain-containing protein [Phenylobacterium sp.]|uniref:PEPxxWA-CTERM sorting domain-containing protein n=1 Tax=Phenylobacterium sp. TaxID=1871053 RepID=UPI003566E01C
MNKRSIGLGALSAVAAAAAALVMSTSAQAQVVYNADLAAPGVYFGSGNPNGAFAVDTVDGVEIGLRAKISGVAPQVVPVANLYVIPIGDTFNFDYSINPDVGGSQVSLASVTALLTVTNLANGHTFSYDPFNPVFGNATSLSAPGAIQNSEKISFNFLGMGYDPNLNDTFNITLSLTGLPNGDTASVTNIVQVGTGLAVPEPATWAMMIVGFAGIGAGLRRARKGPVSATA